MYESVSTSSPDPIAFSYTYESLERCRLKLGLSHIPSSNLEAGRVGPRHSCPHDFLADDPIRFVFVIE